MPDEMARIVETFDGARESVQIVSPDGLLVWANAATCRTLGLSASAIGTPLTDHWPVDVGGPLREAFAAPSPSARYVTTRRPDAEGRTCWWDLSLVPFRDAAGALGGYVLACRDVTERETRKLARDLLVEETRLRHRRTERLATSLMRLHTAVRDDAPRRAGAKRS